MKNRNKILLAELIEVWCKLSKSQKKELLYFAFELLSLKRVNQRENLKIKTW